MGVPRSDVTQIRAVTNISDELERCAKGDSTMEGDVGQQDGGQSMRSLGASILLAKDGGGGRTVGALESGHVLHHPQDLKTRELRNSKRSAKEQRIERTGTLTLRNMAMPRRTSSSAMSCGLETITAPEIGNR